jgi:23S rRNA pseudouridine2605 synthase/23S rRNA pseudouridine2604 synthase
VATEKAVREEQRALDPERGGDAMARAAGDLPRLQKFLAQAGVCSRREAEGWIRAGRVRVNGQVVTRMGLRIDPLRDRVACDGVAVAGGERPVYLMLNKPRGVVTSCRHAGKRTVLDLVKVAARVFPVGRLDEDSTGLLLLTNDGRLHLRLCHPSFDHEKEYEVTTLRPLDGERLGQLADGIEIDGRRTRPAKVRPISPKRFGIVLQEGRKRQIRRMVAALGNRVTALRRIRVASLRLGSLPEGQWRHLSAREVAGLMREGEGA